MVGRPTIRPKTTVPECIPPSTGGAARVAGGALLAASVLASARLAMNVFGISVHFRTSVRVGVRFENERL